MAGGGGSKSSTGTTTTKTELPLWLENATQDYVHMGEDVASRPYEAYGGQRIAGITDDTANAYQGVRDQQGLTGTAMTGLAGQAAQGYDPMMVNAGQATGPMLQQYMNPYTNQVEKVALQNLNSQRMGAQNQLADQARAGNAYGGSRYALQAASTDAQAAQQAGNLSAQLRNQNFTNAQQMAQQDLTRGLQAQGMNQQAGLAANSQNLQGLGLSGQLLGQAQQANYTDLGALEGVGNALRAYNQQGLDQNYQSWLDARNYPLEQLGIMQSVIGSTPYGGTTISSGVQGGSKANPAMGALGGAASGAAAGAAFGGGWGAIPGAIIGGLGGYMSAR